jgi:hypothetical protein
LSQWRPGQTALFPLPRRGSTAAPGGVKGAPAGAAKLTLDAEDRFEKIEKGETSATNPGAESGSITGKDRGPLLFNYIGRL